MKAVLWDRIIDGLRLRSTERENVSVLIGHLIISPIVEV
jgi:hypothetical protein